MKHPSPYLLAEVRQRRKTAADKAAHYGRYDSACAKADTAEALKDVEFYTRILEEMDPKERRQ